MTSVSGSFWPFVLLAVLWIAAFAWLLRRAFRARPRFLFMNNDNTLRLDRRAFSAERDTQSGRI